MSLAKIKKISALGLCILLIVVNSGCISFEKKEGSEGVSDEFISMPLKDVIEVRVEGTIIHYQKESFWNKTKFSNVLRNKEEFESSLIKNFNENLSKYGERNENTVNADVEFNEISKSTILKCNVHGAISKNGKDYHATFKWLLDPLRLDFIDNNFEESKESLSWEGSVRGIQTTVTVELPPQDSIYKAWDHPNGHCHAHVWWSEGNDTPGFEFAFLIIAIVSVILLKRRNKN